MKKRVYIDTAVVGGRFDGEFLADTIPFFNSVIKGEIIESMRKIREDINSEISDMTFAEERAFLDALLTGKSDSIKKDKLKKATNQPN